MDCDTCKRRYYHGITCDNEKCGLDIYKLTHPVNVPKHWTFPEDKEVKPRPGWKWLKLDKLWWFPKLDRFMIWHDKVTKKGSIAQRIGITVEQINESQKNQLADEGVAGKVVDEFLQEANPYFYEGKLKDD